MKQDNKQLRVAYYLRVSTEEQVEKFGLAAQKEALDSILKSRGKLPDGRDALVFAGEPFLYQDDGISGVKELNERPAFARLKEDVLNAPEGSKPFDIVAVFKIDRFARKLKILLDVISFFEKQRIEFISATESIDTSTPFGRAMLGIMGVIAELEVENIKERTQKGREQAIQSGVYLGANAPFGYIKDENKRLKVLDGEAKNVKKIFNLFLVQKQNPQQIADTLTEQMILSPNASAVKHKKRKGRSNKTNEPHFWRPDSVRSILKDEVYIGNYYYNKTKNNKAQPREKWKLSDYHHEAIIPSQLFKMAQNRLDEYSRRSNLTQRKEKDHIYLLSGLLRCEQCGSLPRKNDDLITWHGTKKKIAPENYSYSYICGRKNSKKYSQICSTIPIPADEIEKYVVDFVSQLLKNPQAVFEYQKQLESTKLDERKLRDERSNYLDLLNSFSKRKENIRKQHEIGIINDTQLKEALDEQNKLKVRLNDKIEEIDYRLSQLGLSEGYQKSLEMFADRYSKTLEVVLKDRQQLYDLIHQLVHQIIVYSRPVIKKDSIAGRKKENQFIPEKIDIYLNLPQVLLKELYTQRFGVRTASL